MVKVDIDLGGNDGINLMDNSVGDKEGVTNAMMNAIRVDRLRP